MPTTEENLVRFLLADSTVTAKVGNRVDFNHVPESDGTPYIFFQQQGASDSPALDDTARTPYRPRYAIECWAVTPADAVELKNILQGKLHLYHGTFGSGTVQGIFAEDVSDEYEYAGDGSDNGYYGVALSAEVVL